MIGLNYYFDFKLYQVDVKISILNDVIKENFILSDLIFFFHLERKMKNSHCPILCWWHHLLIHKGWSCLRFYPNCTKIIWDGFNQRTEFLLSFLVKQLKNGIFLSQGKNAKDLVKKFGLDKAKTAHTLMSTCICLSQDPLEENFEQTLYRSMIKSLLYFTISHLDISFSVNMCAWFHAYPKGSHIIDVKWVIKYVKGMMKFGIWMLMT